MNKYLSGLTFLTSIASLWMLYSGTDFHYVGSGLILVLFLSLMSIVVSAFEKKATGQFIDQAAVKYLKEQIQDKDSEIKNLKDMTSQMARLSALGEVAGNMGHEINNQLSVMDGWADQLARIKEDTVGLDLDMIERAGQKIQKHVKRLGKMTSAIRKFVRKSNENELEFVNVVTLVEEVLDLAQPKLKKNHVSVKSFSDSEEFFVECNAMELSQVVLNLISNATDAICDQEKPWIQIRMDEEEDFLVLSVTDSGDGIPKHIADSMMNPYFTTKESGKGTGIGLAISLDIIKAHNGTLHYDDSFKHTRFEIRIPVKQPDSKAMAA